MWLFKKKIIIETGPACLGCPFIDSLDFNKLFRCKLPENSIYSGSPEELYKDCPMPGKKKIVVSTI